MTFPRTDGLVWSVMFLTCVQDYVEAHRAQGLLIDRWESLEV